MIRHLFKEIIYWNKSIMVALKNDLWISDWKSFILNLCLLQTKNEIISFPKSNLKFFQNQKWRTRTITIYLCTTQNNPDITIGVTIYDFVKKFLAYHWSKNKFKLKVFYHWTKYSLNWIYLLYYSITSSLKEHFNPFRLFTVEERYNRASVKIARKRII